MPTPAILGGPINSRLVAPHLSGQSAVIDTENAVRCFGTPVQPVFSRASTAIRADGSQVATGVPRLERGRWHNALTPAAASMSIDSNSDGLVDGWVDAFYNVEWPGRKTLSVHPTGNNGKACQRLTIPTAAGLVTANSGALTMVSRPTASTGEIWSLIARCNVLSLVGCQMNVQMLSRSASGVWGTSKPSSAIAAATNGWVTLRSEGFTLPVDTGMVDVVWQFFNLDNGDSIDVLLGEVELVKDTTAPRFFIPGGYGERGAVMVEEGTTNLLTYPCIGEAPGGNWHPSGCTHSIGTGQKVGTGCLQVTATALGGGYGEGWASVATPAAGTPFSVSGYVKGDSNTAGKVLRLYLLEQGGASGSAGTTKDVTLTTNWQPFTITRLLAQGDRTLLKLSFWSLNADFPAGASLFLNAVMLEQRSYPTSFTPTTRAAESLTLDVRGLLRPEEGAIGGWWYENPVDPTGNHYMFDMDGSDRLRAYRLNGSNYYVQWGAEAVSVAKPAIGWHFVMVRWRGRRFELLVDGVSQGIATRTSTPSFAGLTKLILGCYTSMSLAFWNAPIQRPSTWLRWPGDQEVMDIVRYGPLASGGC